PLSSSQGSSDVSFSLPVSDDEAPEDLLVPFPIFLIFSLSFLPSISLDFIYDNTFFALPPRSSLIFSSESAEASQSLWKLIASSTGSSLESLAISLSLSV